MSHFFPLWNLYSINPESYENRVLDPFCYMCPMIHSPSASLCSSTVWIPTVRQALCRVLGIQSCMILKFVVRGHSCFPGLSPAFNSGTAISYCPAAFCLFKLRPRAGLPLGIGLARSGHSGSESFLLETCVKIVDECFLFLVLPGEPLLWRLNWVSCEHFFISFERMRKQGDCTDKEQSVRLQTLCSSFFRPPYLPPQCFSLVLSFSFPVWVSSQYFGRVWQIVQLQASRISADLAQKPFTTWNHLFCFD